MTCANLRTDWIIRIKIIAKTIVTRFQLWAHEALVKWIPGAIIHHWRTFSQSATLINGNVFQRIIAEEILKKAYLNFIHYCACWGTSVVELYVIHNYPLYNLSAKSNFTSERVIKFNSLSGDSGQWGAYSPYKPCNCSLYIGIIIPPHIDNTQSTGHN